MAAMTKKDALARVRRILDKAPLIDAHNDLPIVIRHQAGCDVRAFDLTRDHQGYDTDIPRLKKGRLDAQWWAAFVPSRVAAPGLVTLEQIDVALEIARAHPEVFLPATRASDVGRAKRLGRIASFVTVESGIGLQNSLAPLRVWYAAGVRLMTLCHNETLDWVDSSTDAASHGGLTGFGEEVVREMNRLGMIVDCAHTSNAAQHRVLDVSRAPVVFSHMNAFSLCNHPRNIADDVLDRLKANGGMVMATFVPSFISQDLRDWLRPATDPFGKAPAELGPGRVDGDARAKGGPGAACEPRAAVRPHRVHDQSSRPRSHRHRLRFLRRPGARWPRGRVEVPRSAGRVAATRLERRRHRENRRRQFPARVQSRRTHCQEASGERAATHRPRQRQLIDTFRDSHQSPTTSAMPAAIVTIWRARRIALRHLNWPRLAWKCSTTGSTPGASKIFE